MIEETSHNVYPKVKKRLNQQKQLGRLKSGIELPGEKNKSKKETDEKFSFFLNLIWKSLKQTAINWNLYLGLVMHPGEAFKIYRYRIYGAQQRKERQT